MHPFHDALVSFAERRVITMRKKCEIILAVIMAVALTGCSIPLGTGTDSNPISIEPAGALNEKSENPDSIVGMANPMVETFDNNDFEKKLGIPIDTSYLPEEGRQMFVIGGSLADIRFNVTNVNGQTVECMLRGTKDAEAAKNPNELIAGVYATDFTDETTIDYSADNGEITVKTVYYDAGKASLSSWDYSDAHFTFTVSDTVSQMQMAELYDSIMLAIGADKANVCIEPLPYSVDIKNIEGGQFNAAMENVETDENGTIADFTLYTMDLYDAVELNCLEVGDTIMVRTSMGGDFEAVEVKSVEHGNVEYTEEEISLGATAPSAGSYDVVKINGGLDNIEEGGVEFIAHEGGTYRYFGFDDHATYSEQGKISLQIAEDAEIVDHSEDWASSEAEPSGVSIKATELMAFCADDTLGFDSLNTVVTIDNGVVVKIVRNFVP